MTLNFVEDLSDLNLCQSHLRLKSFDSSVMLKSTGFKTHNLKKSFPDFSRNSGWRTKYGTGLTVRQIDVYTNAKTWIPLHQPCKSWVSHAPCSRMLLIVAVAEIIWDPLISLVRGLFEHQMLSPLFIREIDTDVPGKQTDWPFQIIMPPIRRKS